MTETQRLDDAVFRVGGELELVPGVAVRGSYEDHSHVFRLGVTLASVRSRTVGLASYDRDGNDLGRAWIGSLHDAEDRTVLAHRKDRRVAVIRLGSRLGDDALSGFSIEGSTNVAPVTAVHAALVRALEDPLTRGVLIELRGVSNFAQLEELRPRIQRLRAAGKPVVAYLEYGASRGDLYLASACNAIVTTPEALFAGLGLLVERRYYRKPLADLGVRFDRTSYGKYKSAYREYSADSTSKDDRVAMDQLLDSVFAAGARIVFPSQPGGTISSRPRPTRHELRSRPISTRSRRSCRRASREVVSWAAERATRRGSLQR